MAGLENVNRWFAEMLPPKYAWLWKSKLLYIKTLFLQADLSGTGGRSTDRHRRALLAGSAATLAKLTSIGVAFVSVPLSLRYLGSERYGMWITITSLASLLSLADLGMGYGILNAVATAHGQDDRFEVRRVISSGYATLTIVSTFLLVTFLGFYQHVNWGSIFNVKGDLARAEAGPAIAAFVACIAISLPVGVINKVQSGLQKGFRSSLWQCGGSVLSLIAIVISILYHAPLWCLVLALIGSQNVTTLANSLHFFFFKESDLRPTLKFIHRKQIYALALAGSPFFILQALIVLSVGFDNFIIARVLGAEAVSEYAVAAQLFAVISAIIGMFLTPLWPAYREALSRGDEAWVRNTVVRSLILTAAAASISSLILIFFAPMLIRLWVGDAIHASTDLLIGLGIWRIIEPIIVCCTMYFNAANILTRQVLFYLFVGLFALVVKVECLFYYGISGLPWGANVTFGLFMAIPYLFFTLKAVRRPR